MTSVSEAVRSENPVKPAATESDEQPLNIYGFARQYEGTYSIRPDECSSVTFTAVSTGSQDGLGPNTAYVINASITQYVDEKLHNMPLSGIARAYLHQYDTLVLMNQGMSDSDGHQKSTPEVAPCDLQVIGELLETFGHDFAKLLGAQTGCYVDSWPLAPSSSPLPKGGLE